MIKLAKTNNCHSNAPGFTALEALIMLVLLAVLAATSLAVYMKRSANQEAAENQGASPSSTTRRQIDSEQGEAGKDAELKSLPILTKK
jgi:type II secretory pathway pseudopilin PulG